MAAQERRTGLVLRPGRPDDAEACGRICYEAFRSISGRHNFPCDLPSAEMAVGLADAGAHLAASGPAAIGGPTDTAGAPAQAPRPPPSAASGFSPSSIMNQSSAGSAAGLLMLMAALLSVCWRRMQRLSIQIPSGLGPGRALRPCCLQRTT